MEMHFTKEGSEKLGNDVADVIMKALQESQGHLRCKRKYSP